MERVKSAGGPRWYESLKMETVPATPEVRRLAEKATADLKDRFKQRVVGSNVVVYSSPQRHEGLPSL